MDHPEVVMLVRFKTSLSLEEVSKVADKRAQNSEALKDCIKNTTSRTLRPVSTQVFTFGNHQKPWLNSVIPS